MSGFSRLLAGLGSCNRDIIVLVCRSLGRGKGDGEVKFGGSVSAGCTDVCKIFDSSRTEQLC